METAGISVFGVLVLLLMAGGQLALVGLIGVAAVALFGLSFGSSGP